MKDNKITNTSPTETDSEVLVKSQLLSIDHHTLLGLTDDDHTQYALLAGRGGGQSLVGGTAASENLTLESTSNAVKGYVQCKDSFKIFDTVGQLHGFLKE